MTASLVAHMVADVAIAGENAAPSKSSGGKAAKISGRPFAEVATKVIARVEPRADKVVAAKASEHPPAGGDPQPAPASEISAHRVATIPPKSGIHKSPARVSTGEVPAWEMLTQVGCEITGSEAPVHVAKGASPKVARSASSGGKEQASSSPVGRRRLPDGPLARDGAGSRDHVVQRAVEGHGHGSSATIRTDIPKGVAQQAIVPVGPEKPVLSKDACVSPGEFALPARQGSATQVALCDAPRPGDVTSDHKNNETVSGLPIPARQGAAVVKPVHGGIPNRPEVESKVLQARPPVEDSGLRPVQVRQVDPTGIQVDKEQSFGEPRRPSVSGSGDVPFEARQTAGVVIGSRQTRRAGEIGGSPMTPVEGGRTVTPEARSVDTPMPLGASEGAGGRGPAASVAEQILDSVHASLVRGEQQIVVRLRPPELGSVLIRFGQDNEGIHGVLEVVRHDTQREIEQALPQMLRSLQELGIQVRRLDVTIAEQPANDLAGGQSQQGAWTPQQGADQHAYQPQRSLDTGWAARPGSGNATESYEVTQAPPDMPADRIDMLA